MTDYGDSTPIPDELITGVARYWGLTLKARGTFSGPVGYDGGSYTMTGARFTGEFFATLYRNVGGQPGYSNPSEFCLEFSDGATATLFERDGAWFHRNPYNGTETAL